MTNLRQINRILREPQINNATTMLINEWQTSYPCDLRSDLSRIWIRTIIVRCCVAVLFLLGINAISALCGGPHALTSFTAWIIVVITLIILGFCVASHITHSLLNGDKTAHDFLEAYSTIEKFVGGHTSLLHCEFDQLQSYAGNLVHINLGLPNYHHLREQMEDLGLVKPLSEEELERMKRPEMA